MQILHTGDKHWVCISLTGCLSGEVNLYDSLFHNIIEDEVKEQVYDLTAENDITIAAVPVQQQQNGSDCGVFSIAFDTGLVLEYYQKLCSLMSLPCVLMNFVV